MNRDLEIAKECSMLEIDRVASKLDIDSKYIENYGKYKAKISLDIMRELRVMLSLCMTSLMNKNI